MKKLVLSILAAASLLYLVKGEDYSSLSDENYRTINEFDVVVGDRFFLDFNRQAKTIRALVPKIRAQMQHESIFGQQEAIHIGIQSGGGAH